MNRKLQRLAAFGLMVVMLVSVFGVAMATDTTTETWEDWTVQTKPGCTTAGVEVRTSNLGKKETRPLAATGHNFGNWQGNEADCDNPSTRYRICTNPWCELPGGRESENIAALGHRYAINVITPATCTAAGQQNEKCTVCSEIRTGSEKAIPMLVHNFVYTVTKQPTCVDKGVRTGICSLCRQSNPEDIPALGTNQPSGHTYGPWSDPTAGDCENEKTRTRTCTKAGCGYKQTEKLGFGKHIVRTTTKNGKTYEWFLREPASMNGPGRAVQTCKVCGKVIKSREIKFEGGRYNIAVTAFGPRASAINSALFGLNDRLIPVDFTKIEEQVFALVTDDGILVGEMRVSVMDDTVSVSYQMNDSQTIVSQAVFYMFPDAQSITAADLSDPTRAMPFGTTLPLNGQTYGVIAARLVVNYNAENSANRAFPDSGIYLDGATNNATILQEMTTNLME